MHRKAQPNSEMVLTVAQLAERLGAVLVADEDYVGREITSVGPIEAAGKNEVTFVTGDKHLALLGKSRAGAVIVARRVEGFDGAVDCQRCQFGFDRSTEHFRAAAQGGV